MKWLNTLGLVFLMATSLFGAAREAEWKKVDEAVQKGLPATAVTNLQSIISAALKDKAYAEAVKAIGKRIALEGQIQGGKAEENILRLEAEISRAPKEMVPMLDTLLAHWYWNFFQQNRWRYMQRTATAQPPGKDILTWDLPRIFAKIDSQYQKALAADTLLKATPVAAWDGLLVKGALPDTYRPTMYDFIANEALDFYCSGEQAGANPSDAFELSAESPALDPAREFLAWAPTESAQAVPQRFSHVLRAVRVFQDLLKFHQSDPAPQMAFADTDLRRLMWAWNTASGETKTKRYEQALESFARTYADFEISARAFHEQANLLIEQGKRLEAHQVAERGAKLFPASPGGKLCRNLISQIEAKSINISTEKVWNQPWPAIEIRYQNLTKVHFRAIAYDWELFLQKSRHRPGNLNERERREVLAKAPALEWSVDLPSTNDFKAKTFFTPAPGSLKPGFYFVVASPDPGFAERNNQVSLADVWVSDLALITRSGRGSLEGFVLDALSGEPLAGAEISTWHLDAQGNRVSDPAQTTDKDGHFFEQLPANRGYLLRARYQGRQVANADDIVAFEDPTPGLSANVQTIFFTDRAIYRPGQMIQYKGICLAADQERDDYRVLKKEELTVVLRDVNGKEISRQKQRANDYGSFSGSFTAPRGQLMGQMTLVAEGRAQGMTAIRVEEYKRPKFEVTLDAPHQAPKLNEKVSLTGHAMAYTGAAIDGAKVAYRITRQVQMPWWWGWWRRPFPGHEAQEIGRGVLTTAIDGAFQIEFMARPDLKVPEKDEPVFSYSVHADVTDTAGETRSEDRVVRVGYTALEATLTTGEWQVEDKPVEIKLKTQSLDGEPQVAEGRLVVYALRAPEKVQRAPLQGGYRPYDMDADNQDQGPSDMSNPNHWPLGDSVAEKGFTTDTNGTALFSFPLPRGNYRVVLETQDRFGKKVTGKQPIQVLKPGDSGLGLKIPNLVDAPAWSAKPGEEFTALWGTGYESGRAFVQVEHRGKVLRSYWTTPGRTQESIKVPVAENMRGGFTVRVLQVRENRTYAVSRSVEVPWSNKELEISWEHFTSKLEPGQKETWTAIIKAKEPGQAERSSAEMVATLYDASLDAFGPFSWIRGFDMFRRDTPLPEWLSVNIPEQFQHIFGSWPRSYESVSISYRMFPPDLVQGTQFRFGRGGRLLSGMATSRGAMVNAPAAAESLAAPMTMMKADNLAVIADSRMVEGTSADVAGAGAEPATPKPDLSGVTPRKNLNETAFFFPQLTTDSNGVVRMSFSIPEALTRWKFLGFAHDSSLRSGFLEGASVTSKDIMVQPNPPRFLREGDVVEFTVKVSNQSDGPQSGTVRLSFTELLNDQSADKLLDLRPVVSPPQGGSMEQPFTIAAKQSHSFAWRISVPDGLGPLTYKAVAGTGKISDGEEGMVPVLSRRILVTESLPLPIRGPATKKFEFSKLLKSGGSRTLQNRSLTVQMVSQPAWYAVLALPYLMEYPHECSEQVFNRVYANALARFIANSDPAVRRVFDQWKNTPALDSPLEKNQDLKSVTLEETPWLRQAANESQARRNVGILFDDNRLNDETDRTLRKLAEMQLADGSWPWFPGGQRNEYISLYIVTGFGRLRHLGVDIDAAPAIRALQRLDAWALEHYQQIQKSSTPEKYVPGSTDALYLYGRSFFLKDLPIAQENRTAVEFFLAQARKFWLQTDSRQTQGHLALALTRFARFGNKTDDLPMAIMKSLKERSVSNEEMGMFWRDTELSWWWYRAPIETQALMIEAFDEVAKDSRSVEDCRVWLLKQKQTQDWKTTKATADAVYALLLRGRTLLSSTELVQVTLGGVDVTPKRQPGSSKATAAASVEPGTGFYEVRFGPGEIKPKLGTITVKKTDTGVSWGSVHWQYLEDVSKVTAYQGTPLKLKKVLFRKVNTSAGPELQAVNGPLNVGDELVVRIELRTDRDMEYVHMKDQRGSGTEPVNVLSQYKYQDGLAYYESTRDTASHFFIDYLPKGVYVFEYSTRVQLRGQYQTGVTLIECMYAPEFNSHSESIALTVQ